MICVTKEMVEMQPIMCNCVKMNFNMWFSMFSSPQELAKHLHSMPKAILTLALFVPKVKAKPNFLTPVINTYKT